MQAAKLPKDSNFNDRWPGHTAERLLRESSDKGARKLQVRIQEKFSFPAVCLVFGLAGNQPGKYVQLP